MTDTFDDLIRAAGGPVEKLRGTGVYPMDLLDMGGDIPPEFTSWREEQQAWAETAVIMDQSQHMVDLTLEGPDAVDAFADLGINDFEEFEPGEAKQFVACNSDGYLIGDGVLYYLSDNELNLVGLTPVNWVHYNVDTGDYDVSVERDEFAMFREGPPERFRYEVQGPNALDIVTELADGPLPELGFFEFDTISIDGTEVYAARHGMLNEAGFEFWGPWEDGDEVKDAILDVGEGHGLRQVGMRAYFTNNLNGWVPAPLQAIYGDEMQSFREWLDPESFEALMSIGGSFNADDVSDYYLTPFEVGYGGFIDYDHDFVGKEALHEMEGERHRTKVTLVWDHEDVTSVLGKLFERPTAKYMELPRPHYGFSMYDRVEHDGETVGVSKWPAYRDHVQEMMSLGIVDPDVSDPGTEVTVVWGEEDSPKESVEDHEEVEITATVAEVPYREDRRKTANYATP